MWMHERFMKEVRVSSNTGREGVFSRSTEGKLPLAKLPANKQLT